MRAIDITKYGYVGQDGFRYLTMDDIETANLDAGMYFFEGATKRFFQSRIGRHVYQGPGGYYFVTSERFRGSDGRQHPRRFTVRRFDPATADIATVGEFNELTRRVAHLAAQHLAEGRPVKLNRTRASFARRQTGGQA